MTETILSANSIGLLAQRILSEANSASIVGVTSRGIFLQIRDRWVIFLTYEKKYGPLTLNILQSARALTGIDPTQSVNIQAGSLIFPKSNLRINTSHAEAWEISPHPQPVLPSDQRDERILATCREILAQRGGIGLTPILANLLHIPTSWQLNPPAWIDRLEGDQLLQSLRSQDGNRVVSQLQPFLGLGSGLTPSGDDLISGFLLTYNRYQDVFHPPFNLSSLNRAILELAYQKTSLLSANLIECAMLGQADERLVLALDSMLAGTLDPASCAELLLSWGNSSGCDALAGMALAAYQQS